MNDIKIEQVVQVKTKSGVMKDRYVRGLWQKNI